MEPDRRGRTGGRRVTDTSRDGNLDPGERAGPPTIRDVADRAGVSTATVSRVLAGIGKPEPKRQPQ